MFRRPKKEITEIIEKPIEKCSFCRKSNAAGRAKSGVYYCASNSCATKLWNRQEKQDAVEFEKKRRLENMNRKKQHWKNRTILGSNKSLAQKNTFFIEKNLFI